MIAPFFRDALLNRQQAWRTVLQAAIDLGIPTPAMSASFEWHVTVTETVQMPIVVDDIASTNAGVALPTLKADSSIFSISSILFNFVFNFSRFSIVIALIHRKQI